MIPDSQQDNDRGPAPEAFRFVAQQVSHMLPTTWATDLAYIAGRFARERKLVPGSVTSREDSNVRSRPVFIVDGHRLRKAAPWLFEAYRTHFLEIARRAVSGDVHIARNDLYAVNLNVQYGNKMVYECHVDSNPVQGVLYTASIPVEVGGALVVARDQSANSIDEVERNCDEIQPREGELLIFDARAWPHYVRSVSEPHVRIAVTMNFYTEDCPESTRPDDLDRHLYGA